MNADSINSLLFIVQLESLNLFSYGVSTDEIPPFGGGGRSSRRDLVQYIRNLYCTPFFLNLERNKIKNRITTTTKQICNRYISIIRDHQYLTQDLAATCTIPVAIKISCIKSNITIRAIVYINNIINYSLLQKMYFFLYINV